MLRFLILICSVFVLLLVIMAEADDKSSMPFCQICDCTDDDVNCQRNVKNYLFDVNYWWNNSTNANYPVDSLIIEHNFFINLNQQFPKSNLTKLQLTNNEIVNISDNVFSQLQQMEMLVLSFNQIELLHPDAFKGLWLDGDVMPLKSLKILKLDHNNIHSLDGDLFEHTSRIESLTLSYNPLKILDQQTGIAITSLVYLKELDLSYTFLSNLPDYFLHTPKYLTKLDLSGNLFEKIPSSLMDSHNLAELWLDNNPIVNISETNGFPLIETLKILHLSKMPKLFNISSKALSKLINLEELYLNDNYQLTYLDRNALSEKQDNAEYETWPSIKKLFLQNSKLATIDMHFLLNWENLLELDLTDNPWTCECENQWMVDELVPIYLKIDEFKAKLLKCAAPIEMIEFTFYDIYEKHSNMRCLDYYGDRPERDAALLVGVLAGVLIAIPLVLFIIYSYQRNWFGIFDNSPASFSRQFYKRTQSTNSDENF